MHEPNVDAAPRYCDLAISIARDRARVMDIVARSIELLNTSVPDTFLGRQRHPSSPEPEL